MYYCLIFLGNLGEGNCIVCDGGKVCVGLGFIIFNRNCFIGYYCKFGVYLDILMDGGVIGDFCIKGYYCFEGISIFFVCAVGFYMNITGYFYCFDCSVGFFCVSGEVDLLRCFRGRYCFGNIIVD